MSTNSEGSGFGVRTGTGGDKGGGGSIEPAGRVRFNLFFDIIL